MGWSGAPAEVSGFGLIGPDDARDLIATASRHPRSRWCVTILGKDGEAIAHGCASGQHPWAPAAGNRDGPAQLAELLRQLRITPAPIAKGECDHQHREDRYRPSRKLRHLIRARTTGPARGAGRYTGTRGDLLREKAPMTVTAFDLALSRLLAPPERPSWVALAPADEGADGTPRRREATAAAG
jgi:hypothetical protein